MEQENAGSMDVDESASAEKIVDESGDQRIEEDAHEEKEGEQDAVIPIIRPTIGYDFNEIPRKLAASTKEFTSDDMKAKIKNNFLKGVKWAPDGSCLATNSEDHILRIFNLPQQLCSYPMNFDEIPDLKCDLKMKESEIIYDFAWFPTMNSLDPRTCFIASTCRDAPVHLWDAYSGRLVASYRSYNYADEPIAAYSIAFNPDATRLYCGFEKCIRVFDPAIPGRQYDERITYAQKQGQTGIISCIAVNPADPKMYAAGSYSKTIGLYDEAMGGPEILALGHKGGVTHIKFSNDGTRLYSGGRKDPEILCWDVRNFGKVLYVFKRTVSTNQRVFFDLSPDDRFIGSGNDTGIVCIWDVSMSCDEKTDEQIVSPTLFFKGHDDCVNGFSFHPTLPLLATTSGQRYTLEPNEDDNDEKLFVSTKRHENSLNLWWLTQTDRYAQGSGT